MGLIDIASSASVWRGYEYYKENKVCSVNKVSENEYDGTVAGSSKEPYYVCAQGRKLKLYRESEKDGIVTSHYRCESCAGCPCRDACCKAKDGLAKELRVRKQFEQYRAISEANVTTDEGIYLRLCRSIQAEGTFALLKTDFGFRRFLTTGKANVRTELFFLALGFNLKKRWMKQEDGRLQTHLSACRSA